MLSPYINQRRLDREHDRKQAQFDAMNPKDAADKIGNELINERMAKAANEQMRLGALSVVFLLASILLGDDYDDAELLPSELLDTLMLDAFDSSDDDEDGGDIDDGVKTTLSAHVADALSTLGVSDDVISDLFNNDVEIADAATLTVAETVLENMPDDGEDFDDFVAAFVYSDYEDEADESGFDSMGQPQFDAAKKLRPGKKTVKKVNGKTLVYKAVKAIRNGKKVVINKRISGNIKLTAGQKGALKKARRKAGNASAIRKQMRSLGKGIRMKIYKGNEKQLRGLKNAAYARHTKANFGS